MSRYYVASNPENDSHRFDIDVCDVDTDVNVNVRIHVDENGNVIDVRASATYPLTYVAKQVLSSINSTLLNKYDSAPVNPHLLEQRLARSRSYLEAIRVNGDYIPLAKLETKTLREYRWEVDGFDVVTVKAETEQKALQTVSAKLVADGQFQALAAFAQNPRIQRVDLDIDANAIEYTKLRNLLDAFNVPFVSDDEVNPARAKENARKEKWHAERKRNSTSSEDNTPMPMHKRIGTVANEPPRSMFPKSYTTE